MCFQILILGNTRKRFQKNTKWSVWGIQQSIGTSGAKTNPLLILISMRLMRNFRLLPNDYVRGVGDSFAVFPKINYTEDHFLPWIGILEQTRWNRDMVRKLKLEKYSKVNSI
ncbi:hypothetical protein CDAR_440851 [Caerostris darwini]|uniref:Uncharacterized protein n=1 Tax=Caerostris darwini TaxID=1538125 RepID=A0AAV4REM0_9ARAC|nr:hypothetical protein CDAR_440851 [Caerostris darwini]